MIKMTNYSKESYIENIKAIGQKIIDKAEYILQDYHDSIREIEIKAYIRPMEIPDIEVNKRYALLSEEEN